MMVDIRKAGLLLRSFLALVLLAAVSPLISSQTRAEQQPAPPAKSGPSPEAMESFQSQIRELREQADELSDRARTAQAALRSIKIQMADMGLDMRLDVREADVRITYLLAQIKAEIDAGDAASAEADLRMAGYAADYIERFLGR